MRLASMSVVPHGGDIAWLALKKIVTYLSDSLFASALSIRGLCSSSSGGQNRRGCVPGPCFFGGEVGWMGPLRWAVNSRERSSYGFGTADYSIPNNRFDTI